MEFRILNRLTGVRQPAGFSEQKGSAAKRPSPGERFRTDRLALSRQAAALLEERTRQEAQERAKKQRDRMAGREETASSPLDAAAKRLKVMRQCQKIAARIMAGDKVPPEDEKFLQESDPAGYQLAMAARKVKQDPKEWDSALEKEQSQSSGASESGGASIEAAESVSGDCGDGGCTP